MGDGWQIKVDPAEFLISEQASNGIHRDVWSQGPCPLQWHPAIIADRLYLTTIMQASALAGIGPHTAS